MRHDTNRRLVLGGLISLPMAFAAWRHRHLFGYAHAASPQNPEASLKKLVLALGPWDDADRNVAEEFASRFVASPYGVGRYPPDAGKLFQSLASRIPVASIAMNEISLSDLPSKERELLTALVTQLYSFVEARFVTLDEPPWGACLNDRTWHTRVPKAR